MCNRTKSDYKTAVTIGEGSSHPLTSSYTYNSNGTIATITDPNGIIVSYDYDSYNRMTKAYRNGELLSEINYSKWANDQTLSFEARAMQNYVETISHNDLTGTNYAKARAYIDPLGRNALSAASVSNAPNALIVSAYTQYDTWDRPKHNYKPFELNIAGGLNSLLYDTPQNQVNGNPNSLKTTQVYQDDPRSRVIKVAKYGIDITSNHIVTTDFCILNGDELMTELVLSSSQLSGWMQNSSTATDRQANLFLKSVITDEDGKQVIEYANAIGQKIATLRFDGTVQVLTRFYYDTRGQLTEVINAEGQSSTYHYNDIGQLYKKQTVDGGLTKFTYSFKYCS
jgi:YD repeat-containing protein